MTIVSSPIALTSASWPGRNGLRCPGCRGDYVHPRFGQTESDQTDDYTCPMGTRGSWTAIPFECENCPVVWRLAIGFHKGQTYIANIHMYVDRDRGCFEFRFDGPEPEDGEAPRCEVCGLWPGQHACVGEYEWRLAERLRAAGHTTATTAELMDAMVENSG